MRRRHLPVDNSPSFPQGKTFLTDKGWKMYPQHLRAIRMDMGLNMTAMASLLHKETGARISRDKYRTWERPRRKNEWPIVPEYIAQATEKLYRQFLDFVTTLVALYDGESPLMLIHRNDMFDEAGLELPEGISVHNYNQAVGKAWGVIRSQGFDPELLYFSTDLSPESIPRTHPPESTSSAKSSRTIP